MYATTAHIEQRKRTGLSAAFQYQPDENLNVVIDGLFTRLDSPSQGYTQSYYMVGNASTWRDATYGGVATELNPQGTFVTGVTMDNLIPELVTITDNRIVDTYQLGVNVEFRASDNLTFEADLYASRSTRDAAGKDQFVVAHGVGGVPNTATYSLTAGGLPNIVFDFDDSTGIDSVADLVNDSQFGPHYSQANGVNIDDKVEGFALHGALETDSEFSLPLIGVTRLDTLEFGTVFNSRTKSRSKYDNQHARELYSNAPFTFDQPGVNVVSSFPVDGFLSDVSGDFPREFASFDIDAYQAALAAADDNPDIINPATGLPYVAGYSDADEPRFNANESFAVSEETMSFYLQANLSGEN